MSSWFTSFTSDWKNQEKVPQGLEALEDMEAESANIEGMNESNTNNQMTPEPPKVEQ